MVFQNSITINVLFNTMETISIKRYQTTRTQLQHCTMKYIVNDYSSKYKSRLLEFKILPLIYVLDICAHNSGVATIEATEAAVSVKMFNNRLNSPEYWHPGFSTQTLLLRQH